MKISDRTRRVLENFASIKSSMRFVPGDVIATMTDGLSIVAQATVEEPIVDEFAISDLAQFLGILRLFSDPDVTVADGKVIVSEGGKRATYTCMSLDLIKAPPIKEVKFAVDASFRLPAQLLKQARDAASTLKSTDLVIAGENGVIKLKAVSVSDPTSDSYSIDVGETDKKFSIVIDKHNLQVISTDYDVDVSFRGYVRLRADGLTYYVSADSKRSIVP